MVEGFPKAKKAMVAMSGGVDSSVTAALLKAEGLEVAGVFMALFQPDLEMQQERVLKIARQLDIPCSILNLKTDFEETVLRYFERSYFQGNTPNPCVICNPTIKFGRLLEHAETKGCDFLATGHYARSVHESNGKVRLYKGADPKKDQSYFLCQLRQEQLRHIYFPFGNKKKTEIYQLAAEFGLEGLYSSSESQDICFMQGENLQSYFAKNALAPPPAGDIVNLEGKRLAHHQGICFYTIGQRRGLGIPDATPYYVVGIDAGKNRILVGKEHDLYAGEARLRNVNWIAGSAPELPLTCRIKIRYRHQEAAAVVDKASGDRYIVRFDQQQRALTPGQFAVFYHGDELLGGGEIIGQPGHGTILNEE